MSLFRKALGFSLSLLVFMSVSALAQEPWLMAKYDRDGDQRITQQEVIAHKQYVFQFMDDNKDGQIELNEYEAADQARRGALLKARFDKLDYDQNGVVTSEEYGSYLGLFDSIDSNGDGALTSSEMGGGQVDTYVTRCLLWFCLKTEL